MTMNEGSHTCLNIPSVGLSMTYAPFIVFGYGSLIFKPPTHVISKVPGFLKGYVRRFAQLSHDHRGTPDSPGRVVTLIHKKDWDAFCASDPFLDSDVVWGVAYTIDPLYESEVREYLDLREQDGYTLECLDVYAIKDGKEDIIIHDAFCYVGHSDNSSFIGSEPLDQLAERIWLSEGPSGRNKDYLFELAHAVRELSPECQDSYLFTVETMVRALDEGKKKITSD